MLNALILIGQAAQDGAGKGAEGAGRAPGLFDNPLLPMIIIFGLFFFLIILPAQRREKKQREATLTKLKKNDEVVTNGGIIGVVHSIKEGTDEVVLKSDETRIRVLKSSIARILTKETPTDGAKA